MRRIENKSVPFFGHSLMVTIKTPETVMDIYNPVATMIRPVVEV